MLPRMRGEGLAVLRTWRYESGSGKKGKPGARADRVVCLLAALVEELLRREAVVALRRDALVEAVHVAQVERRAEERARLHEVPERGLARGRAGRVVRAARAVAAVHLVEVHLVGDRDAVPARVAPPVVRVAVHRAEDAARA